MNDPTQSKYRHISFKGETVYRRFIKAEDELKSSHLESQMVDIPAHGTYGALLFRTEWKAIREEILARDKACVICYNKSNLQVHHRQYHFIVRENKFKLPWEYPKNLLITLCESCHRREGITNLKYLQSISQHWKEANRLVL